jgi:DNA-directed RNA polymerase specialized sigma24 family protein
LQIVSPSGGLSRRLLTRKQPVAVQTGDLKRAVRWFFHESTAMESHESAAEFLRRVEAGEASALGDVYVQFADRMLAFARREINDRLQRYYSAEDAAESAIGSFCGRARDGRYRFDHTGALWRLLRTFTLNKIRRAAEKHRGELGATIEFADAAAGLEPSGREPTPSDVVEQIEELENFLARFSARDAEICKLWFEGYTAVDTAKKLDISKATVNRVRRHVREIVIEKLGSDTDN